MDLDQIDCTPDTKQKLPSNKSMAGQILQEGSPMATSPFLQWRLTAEEEEFQVKAMEKIALSEVTMSFEKAGTTKAEIMTDVQEKENGPLEENPLPLSSRQLPKQDLNNRVNDEIRLQEADINEPRMALAAAPSERPKSLGVKAPKLNRCKVHKVVHDHLDTTAQCPRWPAETESSLATHPYLRTPEADLRARQHAPMRPLVARSGF